ncbi:hypothetical protein DLE03_01770 [Actinobacteria bacterium IMCC25003]|nr:hypothetical protein DLE03_01770 [Actinobacteria bacterium IMCC25003]
MTPKKPDWFELIEGGDSYAGIKKVNKKLPIATLVVACAVILGGSLFANANNGAPAIAETPTASQSVAASVSSPSATTSQSNSLPVPTVTSAPQRGDDNGREGGEREHKERDHEDRDDD